VILFLMLAGLAALVFINVPIAIALASVATVAIVLTQGTYMLPNIALVMYEGAQSFPLLVSITALALIILGGMGNIAGVIVGALVLVGLPELLREFAEFRLLIYGGVLVAMMLLRPEGLVPSADRKRELHDDEEPEEQYRQQVSEPTAAPVIT